MVPDQIRFQRGLGTEIVGVDKEKKEKKLSR